MRLFLFALALALIAPPAVAQDAKKAKRLALVIGNAAYRDAPLPNPLNDADDMEKALVASGFTVIKKKNASLRDMHLALREFGDRIDRQGTGLFYFAGHGLQVRGRNYLVPVDADIQREDEVAFSALDLGAVMEKLDSAKNPVNVVILDACRNNPFGARLQTSAKGLAQVDAPPGTLIAFATAPGSTAADGAGRNGLYTQHLVKQIERPGIPVEEVFKTVRAGVRTDSKNLQIPWESTSLESAFMFRNPPPKPPPPPAPKVAAAAPSVSRSAIALSAPPTFVAGDKWSYRLTNQLDGNQRMLDYIVKEVRGDEVVYANGALSDLLGNSTRVPRAGGRVDLYTPSAHFYLFPMKAGNKWDLTSVQESKMGDGREILFDLKVSLTVVGEEELDLPAGRMRAIRVERVVQWQQRARKDDAGTRYTTFWYSGPVKRWVKMDDRQVSAKGKTTLDERFELASYSVN